MRTKVFGSMLLAAAACVAAVPVFGQKADNKATVADMYVISAEAGAVNYAEGEVTVSRFDGTGGPLIKGDRAKIGDKIQTGNGRAEILLNPGSYLRMGRDTTFQFRSTSLDDLRVRLEKGSAIFEVYTTNEFKVSVYTPKSRVTIAQSGIYRIDLASDGTGTLSVTNGRAAVGDRVANLVLVKEGRSVNLDGKSIVLAKFDKDDMDDFAVWSKDRSKQIAQVAKSFNKKNLRNSLMGSMSIRRGGLGMWVFDARFGYCFISFFEGCSSPYGYGCRGLWSPYNPYYNPYGNTSNNGGGWTPPTTSSSGDVKSIPAPPPQPVYTTREAAPPKSVDIKVIN